MRPRVRNILRKGGLAHHDVEDAIQDIFVSLWRYEGWTNNPPRRSDLIAVAVTAALNRVRDRARRQEPDPVGEVPDFSGWYLVEDAAEWRLQLEETLRVLTPKERTVVARAVLGHDRGRTKREQDRLSLQLRRIRLALRRHIDVSWGTFPVVRWWRDATIRPDHVYGVSYSAAILVTLAGLLLAPPTPPMAPAADPGVRLPPHSHAVAVERTPLPTAVDAKQGAHQPSAASPALLAPASPPTPHARDGAELTVTDPSLRAGIEADLENERQHNAIVCIGPLPVVHTLCAG